MGQFKIWDILGKTIPVTTKATYPHIYKYLYFVESLLRVSQSNPILLSFVWKEIPLQESLCVLRDLKQKTSLLSNVINKHGTPYSTPQIEENWPGKENLSRDACVVLIWSNRERHTETGQFNVFFGFCMQERHDALADLSFRANNLLFAWSWRVPTTPSSHIVCVFGTKRKWECPFPFRMNFSHTRTLSKEKANRKEQGGEEEMKGRNECEAETFFTLDYIERIESTSPHSCSGLRKSSISCLHSSLLSLFSSLKALFLSSLPRPSFHFLRFFVSSSLCLLMLSFLSFLSFSLSHRIKYTHTYTHSYIILMCIHLYYVSYVILYCNIRRLVFWFLVLITQVIYL